MKNTNSWSIFTSQQEKEEFWKMIDNIENSIAAIADKLKVQKSDTEYPIRSSSNAAYNTDVVFKHLTDAINNLSAISMALDAE